MAEARPRYRTVLLMGAPGSGKGTQGKIIRGIPGFYHQSCGDIFRGMDLTSDLGKRIVGYSSRGELVPDELTIQLWAEAIHAHAVLGHFKPRADLLVLDGIPRTLKQAELLDQYLDVLKVIHLVCHDKNAMIERIRRRAIKENRMDDADVNVIRRRWQIYEDETQPVLNHYPREIIFEVNSIGSPAHILYDVMAVLAPLQDKHFTGVLT